MNHRFRRVFSFSFKYRKTLLITTLISLISSVSTMCWGQAQSQSAENGSGSAWGRVLLSGEERPVRQARVTFALPTTGWVNSVLTDADGRFDLPGLSRIIYKETVTAPGCEKLEGTAEVAGRTGPLEWHLRKIGVSNAPINEAVVSVRDLRRSDKARKDFEKGAQLLLKGDAQGSLAYFEQAIVQDKNSSPAYYNMGLAYFRLGNMEEAEQAAQTTIDLTGGRFALADFLMGVVLGKKQEFQQAEIVIQRGLDVDPGSALGELFLGWMQFDLNQTSDAERSAQKALFRKADLAEAFYLLAQVHYREHRRWEMIADLQNFLKLDPHGPDSDVARSLLTREQNEQGKAEVAANVPRP